MTTRLAQLAQLERATHLWRHVRSGATQIGRHSPGPEWERIASGTLAALARIAR